MPVAIHATSLLFVTVEVIGAIGVGPFHLGRYLDWW